MRQLTLALVAAAVLAAPPFASPAFADPPPPYQRHVCANGLEVLVVERHATPLFTVEIVAHNGGMTESPEFSRLSHLFEHMFFKGNKVLPDQLAYLARTRELGMLFNASTWVDRVEYHFTTTSDHFADAMALMRDSITSPLFDKAELDRERVVITGEMDRDESDPRHELFHDVERRVYWKYPTRKWQIGDRKTVLSATPELMRTIQHRYYIPNNMALVVVGDVKADEVFKQADELYAGWAKGPDPFVKFPLVTHPPIPRSEAVVVPGPVQTFTMMAEWLGPSTLGPSAPYSYASDLLGTILEDPGSKFQKALIDSGVCVAAGLGWFSERDQAAITLFAEAPEEKANACVAAAFAELQKMKSPDYFTDDEMKNAAHRVDVSLANSRELTESYADQLAFWWGDADLAYYQTYVDRLRGVTRADIAKYLDTYVLGKPFILGALESPELAKTIDKAHLESLVGAGVTQAKPHGAAQGKAAAAKAQGTTKGGAK
jgi:zinc protease